MTGQLDLIRLWKSSRPSTQIKGNARDRYIAGEDVPFTEVRKVWRNTTQSMCGELVFFEQFFPLVRTINQKLPPAKRLRVLAGDPPIDWDQVKSFQDALKFLGRNPNIASVMEKEVLSKHRKALMLFVTVGRVLWLGCMSTRFGSKHPG